MDTCGAVVCSLSFARSPTAAFVNWVECLIRLYYTVDVNTISALRPGSGAFAFEKFGFPWDDAKF